ncbi:MAG: hypothetical protein KDB00_17315 [Planctomycetales bacterium]|nr:hypothetical protein [Planctomycetales bacterium]
MNKTMLGLAFALLCTTVVVAQDAPDKKKKSADGAGRPNAAATILKQLKDAELTDEQTAKIQELAKKSMAEMRAIRKEAGITPEIMKKRTEAQKELKDSGKKPAEMFAAVNEKAGLNEAQIAAIKKTDASRAALLKDAVALLSDEQKAKLPKRVTQAGKQGDAKKADAAKGKNKKKKTEDN